MLGLLKFFSKGVKYTCNFAQRNMASKKRITANDYYVWIDLEMTGLDLAQHKIVEVACLLTNPELDIIDEGIHLIVHQPEHVFENECSKWAYGTHKNSGLIDASINSKISVEEADQLVSDYIKKTTNHINNVGKYYLSGNSVYMDKMFLEKYMPIVNSLLHYRIIDVSSIKELCSRWYPMKFRCLDKKSLRHRALDDIKESIEELKTYRINFFVSE